MKTIILSLILTLTVSSDPGRDAYTAHAMESAGTIPLGKGTYQSGWARGLTPSQARARAEAHYDATMRQRRAEWEQRARTTPHSRVVPFTPSTISRSRSQDRDTSSRRPSSSGRAIDTDGEQFGRTRWLGE